MLSRLHLLAARRPRPQARHCGPLARPRRLGGQTALLTIALGAAATAALTEIITVNNRIVVERAEIDRLRSEKAYLEATIGGLEGAWGRLAARDSVVARAGRELGLVIAEAPGAVVVVRGDAAGSGNPAWRRVLDTVGGAEGVAAAAAQERRP
ncbi:MAG: hypothetical protein ACYDIE_03125 [Candidatus Krumholzibacteriia bacterium]